MGFETEDVQKVMQATGADWKTAARALADALKELTPKKKKGFAALGSATAGPTREVVLARALELMKEPIRDPKNIAAIAILKKETKLPLKQVRAAMVEVEYDVEAARAKLQAAGSAPKNKKAAKPKKPGWTRLVAGGVARDEDEVVLHIVRRKVLTKEETAVRRELQRNGEYAGNVEDHCLVRRLAGTWKRVTPFVQSSSMDLLAFGYGRDGLLTWVQKSGDAVHVQREGEPKAVLPGYGREAVVGEGGVLVSIQARSGEADRVWKRDASGDWAPIDFEPSTWDQVPAGTTGGNFVSTHRALFREHDGGWQEIPAAPAEPAAVQQRPFTPVAIGPDGQVATGGTGLWLGTLKGLARARFGPVSDVSFVGDAVVYELDRWLFLRRGDQDQTIRKPSKGSFGKTVSRPWFASPHTIYSIGADGNLEVWSDDAWSGTALDAMWTAVGAEEPPWVGRPAPWM